MRAQRLPQLGLRTTLRRSGLLQRLLGVGLGIDVASMVLGALLLRPRQHARTAWREGAGSSFLLHGLALLIFDAGVFWRNAHYHRQVLAMGRTSSGKVLVVSGSGLGAARVGTEQLPHPASHRRQDLAAPRPEA